MIYYLREHRTRHRRHATKANCRRESEIEKKTGTTE